MRASPFPRTGCALRAGVSVPVTVAGDEFNLQRFVDAQDRSGVYAQALAELRSGHKRSHWIWFVFPQIAGLGSSETARRYGIGSLGEAAGYLAHPLLGPRLIEVCEALLALQTDDAAEVLERFYGGEHDAATERLL